MRTAYGAMIEGSLGSLSAITSALQSGDRAAIRQAFYPVLESLVSATPYIFAGLAVAVGFKCGLFNIGVEGQLFVGAIFMHTALDARFREDGSWYRLEYPSCDVALTSNTCWDSGEGFEEDCALFCSGSNCEQKCTNVGATGQCEPFTDAVEQEPSSGPAFSSACGSGEVKCRCLCDCTSFIEG